MSLLTDDELGFGQMCLSLWSCVTSKPLTQREIDFASAIESAVLAKLAGMELPEPETFEAWNSKQHGDPEEIGLLQALRIAYCCGQDSVNQRQAYAQGAASQLVQKKADGELQERNIKSKVDRLAFNLFTRKEPS